MVQVFGLRSNHGEQHYQDWAKEPYTCSALDRTSARQRTCRRRQSAAAPGAVGWKAVSRRLGNRGARRRLSRRRAGGRAADRASLNRGSDAGRGAAHRNRRADGDSVASINADESRPLFRMGGRPQDDGSSTAIAIASTAASRSSKASNSRSARCSNRWKRCSTTRSRCWTSLPFDMVDVAVERGRSALTPGVQQPFGDPHAVDAGRRRRLQPDVLRAVEFPGRASSVQGISSGDPARHRRGLAGILAGGQPAAAGEGAMRAIVAEVASD